MKLSKKIYYNIASLIPNGILHKFSGIPVLYPYQHTVSDSDLLHIKHLYSYKNEKQFALDIDKLLKRFKPISLQDAIALERRGGINKEKYFLLSFDDGFKEAEEIIAPLLYKKGVPAIFFINPAFIDNKELFYRCKISLIIEGLQNIKSNDNLVNEYCNLFNEDKPGAFSGLIQRIKRINNENDAIIDKITEKLNLSYSNYLQEQKPFLTTVQVKKLISMGFFIGGHSWNHPYYKLLNIEEQIRQTMNSVKFVKGNFDMPYSLFSFPHSDNDVAQQFFENIKRDENIDLLFGTQNQKVEQNNRMVHRFNMERPGIDCLKQIDGIFLLAIVRNFFKKNHVLRG